MSHPSIGVLLLNLGTPDAPTTPAVRRYLREFLSDPRVIDIHPIARWMLVNLVISPFRSPKSAHAYQQVWTERGSPLLVAGVDLAEAVQAELGQDYRVVLGMRYANPSVRAAIDDIMKTPVERIVVLPLFPQYASASTGSAIEKVMIEMAGDHNITSVHVYGDFFEHPGFISSQAHVIRQPLADFGADKVLLSYHGLPERHLTQSCDFSNCDLRAACPPMHPKNRFCYRAQCYATSRALAADMGWTEQDYDVSFQSRLGRTPWVKPWTDEILEDLVKSGVKRLAVLCPAFVADCLETLEEIGIRAREQWKGLGGEELLLLPCVNADPVWARAVANMVRDDLGRSTPTN